MAAARPAANIQDDYWAEPAVNIQYDHFANDVMVSRGHDDCIPVSLEYNGVMISSGYRKMGRLESYCVLRDALFFPEGTQMRVVPCITNFVRAVFDQLRAHFSFAPDYCNWSKDSVTMRVSCRERDYAGRVNYVEVVIIDNKKEDDLIIGDCEIRKDMVKNREVASIIVEIKLSPAKKPSSCVVS